MVKQADFRASLESDDLAPTLIKWGRILDEMHGDGTPFTLKELKITSTDLIALGFKGEKLGKELNRLWDFAVLNPNKNNKEYLLAMANKDII